VSLSHVAGVLSHAHKTGDPLGNVQALVVPGTGVLVDSPAVITCPPIYAGLNTTGAEEYVAVPS